jgi:cytoskeletal protein CcmA (bactofilin family)
MMVQAKRELIKEVVVDESAGDPANAPVPIRAGSQEDATLTVPEPTTRLVSGSAGATILRDKRGHWSRDFATRNTVITGEVVFRGVVAVDGMISGQIGVGYGSLGIRQRTSGSMIDGSAEMSGELSFVDALRVNGHVEGYIHSERGTLIVDSNGRVDANIDVAIAVIGGTVNGEVLARERVELGPTARVSGSIHTRSLTIENGATFDGACGIIRSDEEHHELRAKLESNRITGNPVVSS